MATNPTTAPPIRRKVWSILLLTLFGAFQLGTWTCRLDRPGADLWGLGSVLFLVGYAGMVIGGLYELQARIRRMERGPA